MVLLQQSEGSSAPHRDFQSLHSYQSLAESLTQGHSAVELEGTDKEDPNLLHFCLKNLTMVVKWDQTNCQSRRVDHHSEDSDRVAVTCFGKKRMTAMSDLCQR